MAEFQRRSNESMKVQSDDILRQSSSTVMALKLQISNFGRQLEIERSQKITIMAQLDVTNSSFNTLIIPIPPTPRPPSVGC
jgi:hypothetical protein